MSRSRPNFGSSAPTGGASLSTVGRLTTRVGMLITVTAAPLALLAFLVILVGAPTLGSGLEVAMAAASGPLSTGGGIEWLFHVGVLGVLAGSWILGVGLILSGLSD